MRTYAVTGAASGIGAAVTRQLRGEGHRVITVDRHEADVVADLSTAEGRTAAVEDIRSRTGVLHGLVPCAGVAGLTGVDSTLVTSVNFFGAIALVRGLHAQLAGADGSSVVLIASNSITGMPGWSIDVARECLREDEPEARRVAAGLESVMVYPATKAALAWWARREGVKPDWIGAGIRMNSVAPGKVETPMTAALAADPVFGQFGDAYPTAIGRDGRPEEIAALVCFLLNPASSLLVGSVLYADGGTDAILHPISPPGWEVGELGLD